MTIYVWLHWLKSFDPSFAFAFVYRHVLSAAAYEIQKQTETEHRNPGIRQVMHTVCNSLNDPFLYFCFL